MEKIKLILSIVLISLFSCGRITDEQASWTFESLPVVFSVISPSNTIHVSLSKTIVQNEKTDTIYYPMARVFACGEDKEWVELVRESYDMAVYADVNKKIEVKEGKTYFLRVELGDKTVSAQTTVPLQKSKIIEAEFIADSDQPVGYESIGGEISVKVQVADNERCILTSFSNIIGSDNSTFIQQQSITDRIYIPDTLNSFNLQLITFDSYFARYWAAKEIASQQNFSEGDISVFTGAFNGLLPPYSNIVNGIGLFGSYVSYSKSVNIIYP